MKIGEIDLSNNKDAYWQILDELDHRLGFDTSISYSSKDGYFVRSNSSPDFKIVPWEHKYLFEVHVRTNEIHGVHVSEIMSYIDSLLL